MPYLDKLLNSTAGLPKTGVTVAWVAHDHDCPRLRNGPCTCEPEIEMLTPEEYQARLTHAPRP